MGVNSAGVLTQGKPLAAPLTAAGQRRILTGLSPLPPRPDHLGTDAQPYHRYFQPQPRLSAVLIPDS